MQLISQKDIPRDYFYYRSHTPEYQTRIMQHSAPDTAIKVQEKDGFWRIHHFFWGAFSYAVFEKTDLVPTRELLAKHGMKRGIVLWSWWKKQTPISSLVWKSLGYLFSRQFHHSTRSAFSVLDAKEYWKKWSSNARNHRKKAHTLQTQNRLKIDTEVSCETFLQIYKKTKVPHSLKRYLSQKTLHLAKDSKNVRFYLAYLDSVPLAGAFFLDDFPTSTYVVAFQDPKAKPYHLGLALIDRWFEESQKRGFVYLDFDHMRDTLDPYSYAGYTKFKSELADFQVRFPKVWLSVMM